MYKTKIKYITDFFGDKVYIINWISSLKRNCHLNFEVLTRGQPATQLPLFGPNQLVEVLPLEKATQQHTKPSEPPAHLAWACRRRGTLRRQPATS